MGHQTTNQKSKTISDEDTIKEMLPFLVYAAIPLAITFLIAFTMGYTHQ